jgi:hypothetical protein
VWNFFRRVETKDFEKSRKEASGETVVYNRNDSWKKGSCNRVKAVLLV